MLNQDKRTKPEIPGGSLQRSYNEIIEFLDANWPSKKRTETSLSTYKKLDKAMGSPSTALKKVLVGGTNGKSLTTHFATKLLQQEGLSVGVLSSPHILTYNERFLINNEAINNKNFTDIANEVLNTAAMNDLSIDSLDVITMIALKWFEQNSVDLVLLEQTERFEFHPLMAYNHEIVAITRLTDDMQTNDKAYPQNAINSLLCGVKKGSFVVSGDQSKAHLQTMLEKTEMHGGSWAMPIRKLAALPYPFEQLHGRCAALAERIAQLFVENFADKAKLNPLTSLLAQAKGQRGRPTLEAKRQAEMNPKRTMEQFWKETAATLPAGFNLLDKEKPSILLDNACNIDALKNLFLGIRLLHYQRPFKGVTFIFGCDQAQMFTDEFLRLLRYFTKKNSAQIIFCPITKKVAELDESTWDIEKITNDVKNLKIKAKACASFEEAFEAAKLSVDERHGLVVITGSQSIITQYWEHKGIKKF